MIEVRRSLARKPELNSIPFIFLTAHVSQSDKVHGIDLGAVDYITKPFDREEFLACIRAVLCRADLSRQQGRVEAEAQYGRAAPGDLKDSDPRSYGPQ